jgi:hypothetical protein
MPPHFPSRYALRFTVVPALLGVAMLASAGTAASASGWSTPKLLNAGGNGFGPSTAIDSSGNVLVTWLENLGNDNFDIQFADHLDGGAWKKSRDLVPPSNQLIVADPVVHETAAGTATAVWWTTAGAWTADRPAGGSWTTPLLVLPGLAGAPAFRMNSQGAAVLAWETGQCGIRDTGNCTIMTLTRPAGGGWGQPVSVETTSNRSGADSVVIGEGGDAIVTWETFKASCNPELCSTSNFILFAARQPAGTTNWQIDQSSLAGPDPVSHVGAASLDKNNLAAVFIDSQTTGITAVTEPSGSQAFGTPVTVTSDTDITLGGAQADASGDVTLVGLEGSARQVVAISGNFDTNTWNGVVTLSNADTDIAQSSFPVAFAVGANGESIAAWPQASTMQSLDDNVVVSVSPSPGARWSKPVVIAKNAEAGLPQSVSVNNVGQAVLSYSDLNATTNADEIQATVYTPKATRQQQ